MNTENIMLSEKNPVTKKSPHFVRFYSSEMDRIGRFRDRADYNFLGLEVCKCCGEVGEQLLMSKRFHVEVTSIF